MAFTKGKSGNPNGRSKAAREREEALKEALDAAFGDPNYFAKKLKEFIEFGSDHQVKLAATKLAMEYNYGKPRQQVEVEVTGTIELASALEKARKRANARGR